MSRVSRVGDGWTTAERTEPGISWYADVAAWLDAEAAIDYGSVIEGIAKGVIGTNLNGTTTTQPPHGWYLYADPGTEWLPDGSNNAVCPTGNRIYFSTPDGLISGIKFTASNNFNGCFRFLSTALRCVAQRCIMEHAGTNPQAGGEAIRVTSSVNVADRPQIIECHIIQLFGKQPAVRQSATGGHLLLQSCVIYNPDNRYVIGNSSSGGTTLVYDSVGIGASTGDGFAAASVTLFSTSSEDVSGTPGLTGINQSALVDYANNDIRTAAGGPLDVPGTNQAFIGVALGGAVTNSITLNEFAANYAVFQAPDGSAFLTKAISGAVTGDPSAGLQWRLYNNANGETISGYDWATLIAEPSAGAFSQSVNIPVNTSLVKYNIEVRFTADTAVTDTLTNPFSVGPNVLDHGQSNALRRVTRTTGTLTPSEFAAYFDGTDWAAFPTGDGAIAKVNDLIAALGVPVGYHNYAVDSQSIAQLNSGTHWNSLVNGVTAAGGDFSICFLDVQERDGQLGTAAEDVQAGFQLLHDNMLTLTGRNATQFTMVVNYGGNSNGYAGGYTSETIEEVRAGKAAFVAANDNVIWGGHRFDLPLSDTIHNTAEGYAIAAQREVQSYLHYVGLADYPGAGKTISNVNLAGNVVTVSYSADGDNLTKTGTGASTITQISADDFATQLTITDTVVNASSVTHTLSTAPSGPVKVRDWWGADIPLTSYQGLVFPSVAESSLVNDQNYTTGGTVAIVRGAVAGTSAIEAQQFTTSGTVSSVRSVVAETAFTQDQVYQTAGAVAVIKNAVAVTEFAERQEFTTAGTIAISRSAVAETSFVDEYVSEQIYSTAGTVSVTRSAVAVTSYIDDSTTTEFVNRGLSAAIIAPVYTATLIQ